MGSLNLSLSQEIELLEKGADQLGIGLTSRQLSLMGQYLALLIKWNKAYNLTSVRDPKGMVTRHLLDSLTVAPYMKGARILDVGSGPGLPGVPLSILHPDKCYILLDSNGKKTRFLKEVKMQLNLDNVLIVKERVERFQDETGFDSIICRAYSSAPDFFLAVAHLGTVDCRYMTMKGQLLADELNSIPDSFKQPEIIKLKVPCLSEERHLVVTSKNA